MVLTFSPRLIRLFRWIYNSSTNFVFMLALGNVRGMSECVLRISEIATEDVFGKLQFPWRT